jgi:hypothetical protein
MSSQPMSPSVRHAHEILELVAVEATDAGREDLPARLGDARRLLEDNSRVRVQVVGGPGQGKSALIEALLVCDRQEVFRGTRGPRLELLETSSSAVAPSWPVSSGTGSLSGSSVSPSVAQAHAALFVSDSSASLTTAELEQLRQTVDLCPMTVFVQTKIDAYQGWQAVLEQNIARMRAAGLSVETWVISSVGRLRGEWTGDDHASICSGVPALHNELHQLCLDFESTGLRVVAHHLLAVLGELRDMVVARRSELSTPAGTPEQIRTDAEDVDARLGALRDRAARWPAILANGFATIHADAAFDLRRRVEGIRTHLDAAIADGRPFDHWDTIMGWLRERLAFEAHHNALFAVHAGAGFSTQAAAHFGLEQPLPVRVPEAPRVPRIPAVPEAHQEPADQVVKLGAAMSILMRAWMGFMMYYLIAGIAHLNLSPLVGLAPAALLAMTAVVEERKQWINRERGQAAVQMHKYVDMTSTMASNDASDALRKLEQGMRESYGAYLDRGEGELVQAQHVMQARLTDVQVAPELLEEIETGLRYYDQLRSRASTLVAAHMVDASNQAQN